MSQEPTKTQLLGVGLFLCSWPAVRTSLPGLNVRKVSVAADGEPASELPQSVELGHLIESLRYFHPDVRKHTNSDVLLVNSAGLVQSPTHRD